MSTRPELTPEQITKQLQRKAAKEAKKAQAKLLSSSGQASGNNGNGNSNGAAGGGGGLSEEQKAEIERKRFLKRDWIDLRMCFTPTRPLRSSDKDLEDRVKIVTWNVLAQTLVRRELFPGSDCLRWSDRKAMLSAELEQHGIADIICLQECDRLNEFSKSLPQHDYVKGSGPGKQHGLVIFYRSPRFIVRASKLIHLDLEELSPAPNTNTNTNTNMYTNAKVGSGDDDNAESARKRRGGSRQTKNVGLIVALQDVQNEKRGIVVATTHLFWHPKYAYERLRQCIILMRNIRRFQSEHDCTTWPAVFSGDLNTEPDEATYQLLTAPHTDLPSAMAQRIDDSRLVHDSAKKIAPIPAAIPASGPTSASASGEGEGISTPATASVTGTGTNTPSASASASAADDKDRHRHQDDKEEGGEGEAKEEEEDDKSLPNTRPARTDDGILSTAELVEMIRKELPLPQGGLISAYAYAHAHANANAKTTSDQSKLTSNDPQEDGDRRVGGETDKNGFDVRESFGGRGGFEQVGISNRSEAQTTVQGYGEPAYTCFTPLFRLTLDYLLLLPPYPSSPTPAPTTGDTEDTSTLPVTLRPEITGVLSPPKIDELGEGLPRKGLCASDHLAFGCEITW
ncbi:hypothetical protein IAT40_005726 [Kwoniella sp. CBS 6097]